jgi:hypothetical protein
VSEENIYSVQLHINPCDLILLGKKSRISEHFVAVIVQIMIFWDVTPLIFLLCDGN